MRQNFILGMSLGSHAGPPRLTCGCRGVVTLLPGAHCPVYRPFGGLQRGPYSRCEVLLYVLYSTLAATSSWSVSWLARFEGSRQLTESRQCMVTLPLVSSHLPISVSFLIVSWRSSVCYRFALTCAFVSFSEAAGVCFAGTFSALSAV